MKTEGSTPRPLQAVVGQCATASASTNTHKAAKISTFLRRVALLLLILILYCYVDRFRAMSLSKQAQLSHYTDSVFIPFVFEYSIEHDPQVLCTIEGVDIEMPVDTGSTGLLIGAPILPNISSTTGTPAHHFFTSSKILYVGRLVELSVCFHGAAGSRAIATVPVFIVDKSWRCPGYDPNKDRFDCPLGPDGERPVERDTSTITYMGVGFGRNRPRDGMPFGAPKLNPFLNIDSVDGAPVSSKSMRAGYVISTAGVHLGITREDTQRFAFVDLQPGFANDQDPRDWAMPKMCFQANDGEQSCGSALVDTGIPQMYLRPSEGVAIPTVHIPNPNKNGYAKMVRRVAPETSIVVGFPSLKTPVVSRSFVVGGGLATDPSAVIPLNQTSPPYINTGRSFLFEYAIAFDAVGGRFGFRPTSRLPEAQIGLGSSVL